MPKKNTENLDAAEELTVHPEILAAETEEMDEQTDAAQVPVSESMDFPVRLSAITSGKGVLSARFSEYRICPPEFGKSTKRREVNPLDRSKWILYKRNASAF